MNWYIEFHNGTYIFGIHGVGIHGRGATMIEAEKKFFDKMGRK